MGVVLFGRLLYNQNAPGNGKALCDHRELQVVYVDRSGKYPYISVGAWFTRYYYLQRKIQLQDCVPTHTDRTVAAILLSYAPRVRGGHLGPHGRVATAELTRMKNGTYPYNDPSWRSSEAGLG